MSVYFIVTIKMLDTRVYNNYLELCDDVFKKYKGKYLAVDETIKIVEGNIPYTRVVIIEFETENDFNEWYYSEDYQRIVKYRIEGAECNSVLVHGK
jgi:uncharacterized protein (DUF1330 family)